MARYACSDMHGCIEAYHTIKNFIKPEDIVYCLGDCGDRGKHSWQTIKAVYEDPQFFYLKGNHEDMLVKAAKEYFFYDGFHNTGHYQRMLFSNGGRATLQDLTCEEDTCQWIKRLSELPTLKILKNDLDQEVILTHAGLNWEGTPRSDQYLLWDREHYLFDWDGKGKTVVVHGHTPMTYLAEEINQKIDNITSAFKYSNDSKYCIDCGTVFTDKTLLLNLDTWNSIVFDINK